MFLSNALRGRGRGRMEARSPSHRAPPVERIRTGPHTRHSCCPFLRVSHVGGLLVWHSDLGEGPGKLRSRGLVLRARGDTSPPAAGPETWSSMRGDTWLSSHSSPQVATAALSLASRMSMSAIIQRTAACVNCFLFTVLSSADRKSPLLP